MVNNDEIMVKGFTDKNAVKVRAGRVSHKYNSIKITIKKEIVMLSGIKIGDEICQYYDPDKKVIVLRPQSYNNPG